MYGAIKAINDFLELINKAQKEFPSYHGEIKQCEKELLDIQHEIEMVKHTYSEKAKIYTRQNKILLRRREYKDKQEFYEPLIGFIAKTPNLVQMLAKIKDNMQGMKIHNESRVYKCRTENRVLKSDI